MKIAVLCNHPLGLPAIDYLLANNLLAGIACPQIPNDNFFRLQFMAQDKNIPFGMIDEANLQKSLSEWIKKTKADIVFIFTFPYKIPKDCLKIPRLGFLNFHTGLLPSYRGGDPIFWQIFAQEKKGGVSVHKTTEDLDKGPLAYIEAVEILGEDTYGQHIQKIAIATKKACTYIVENFPNLKFVDQDESLANYQNRPNFYDLIIDWERFSASQIKALIRASNPTYGGAITFFRGVPVHILQVSIGSAKDPMNVKAGTIISSGKDGIIVATSDNKLMRLDIVYTEDGFFTGGKLAVTFDIKEKELFTLPPLPPNPEEVAV